MYLTFVLQIDIHNNYVKFKTKLILQNTEWYEDRIILFKRHKFTTPIRTWSVKTNVYIGGFSWLSLYYNYIYIL